MKHILFKLITPEKVVIEKEIAQATLPIADGEITVLPEHIPYIGVLKAGEITVRATDSSKGTTEVFAVSGGFAEFRDNTLTLLADTAEPAEAIDIARAEEARQRAEMLMQKADRVDAEGYARVAASLEKELSRLRIARKHHSRKGTLLEE